MVYSVDYTHKTSNTRNTKAGVNISINYQDEGQKKTINLSFIFSSIFFLHSDAKSVLDFCSGSVFDFSQAALLHWPWLAICRNLKLPDSRSQPYHWPAPRSAIFQENCHNKDNINKHVCKEWQKHYFQRKVPSIVPVTTCTALITKDNIGQGQGECLKFFVLLVSLQIKYPFTIPKLWFYSAALENKYWITLKILGWDW